jgi:hypothetical protein
MGIGKHFPFPVGSFVSSNLTPAGRVNHYSDGEIFRAIRNGVDADGHWLTVMSYTNAGKLSDDDIQALIAYIRSQPGAGQETVNPPDQLNLLGVIMLGAGMLPGSKPVFTGVITAPPKALPCNMANISYRIRIAANATALIWPAAWKVSWGPTAAHAARHYVHDRYQARCAGGSRNC